jgi:putative ABC transport system permease protein
MKFWRQRKDEELDAEIRSHLDAAIRDWIERGESPHEARLNALREFGNLGLVKEVTREMWGWATLERLGQDLRFGLRMLWKNPGFSLVAILTLALGIGTNTAIFSIVNGVLLRPLPFPNAERLVYFESIKPDRDIKDGHISMPDYFDWQSQADAFESISLIYVARIVVTGDNTEPEFIPFSVVPVNFFQTMGVHPIMGREFVKEDRAKGAQPVAIISYGLWQRRFGANPNVLGSPIMLGGTRCIIIGVMPGGFDYYPSKIQIWAPLYVSPNGRRDNRFYRAVARLKPWATIAGAQSQMDTINARLQQQYVETNAGWSVRLHNLQAWTTRDIRTSLLLLLGAVGFVLLIACANIANLLLARATARRKEITVRTALGAGRWRIVRQLLTESSLLAITGGVVGLALSIFLTKLLIAISPADLARLDQVGLDARVLGFTVGVIGLVGLLFGLAPALQASKPDLNDALKEGGRGSREGYGRNRVRAILVVSEIALSLLLLIGAGLLIKSFMMLRDVNAGFDQHNVLTMYIGLPGDRYKAEQQATFFRELTKRASALPGVESAGAASALPLSGVGFLVGRSFIPEGRPLVPEESFQTEYFVQAGDYFQTMRIPIKAGRTFTDHDTAETAPVVVINETAARRVFPGQDPIGKRIIVWRDEKFAREIVGVVGDVKAAALDEEVPSQIYVPHAQDPGWGQLGLAVRAKGEPEALTSQVRGVIHSLDKDQPPFNIRTMDQAFSESVAKTRLVMLLFGVFSMFALLLASIGIYGVIAYSVAQRTHEIGIRLALGAQTTDVRRMIVTQGMILTLTGAGLGLAGAFAATRVMRGLLYGVSATDPLIFIGVSLLLTVVALLACYIPARRATKVDPMIALRYE